MKRKLMICAMALCICAGLAGNTGEVSVIVGVARYKKSCSGKKHADYIFIYFHNLLA